MYRKMILALCLVLFSVALVVAEEIGASEPEVAKKADEPEGRAGSGASGAKTLSGMAVLGNNEAPMSLFIVPWKSSELGVETNLTRTLNERDVPVDREVFMRELAFYQVSAGDVKSMPATVTRNIVKR